MFATHALKITACKWSFLLLVCLFGSFAQAETITDFKASYIVQADGAVVVHETIVYDFEGEERHGIFRTLETDHAQPATKKFHTRLIDIEVLDVKQDAIAATYEVSKETGELTIKIGDPDQYIIGVHEYTIEYILRGALSYGAMGAEFYYNVTGNGWEVPIRRATAVVVGEKTGILAKKAHCYQGAAGVLDDCSGLIVSETGTAFTADDLDGGEGLTIAQEINQDTVAQLIIEKPNVDWILWLVGALWIVGLSIWAWRFHRGNKTPRPVIAQYEPYEDFLPMYTGVIFDNSLDPHDITAGILYLAEQGFISIKRTEEKVLWIFNATDYEITLKQQIASIPTIFLQKVATLLFGIDGTSPATLPVTVLLSSLAKQRQENLTSVVGLQASLKADLQAKGFLEPAYGVAARSVVRAALLVWIPALLVVLVLSKTLSPSFLPPLVVTAVITFVIVLIAVTGRRSEKGYEALNHLQGFKLFLSVTDKERFAFHNAPDKSPEVFMKYLPYAIALKVEKEWAKVFEGVTIPNPSWYDGGSMTAFSAAAFTSDMSAFSTSFSSSSGTSGSSGGGSSGGGGGGGGGGSW